MSDAKPWWMSRAILGGAVAILAGFFGLSTADAVDLTKFLTDAGSLAGGALAIYGRIKAKRPIAAP